MPGHREHQLKSDVTSYGSHTICPLHVSPTLRALLGWTTGAVLEKTDHQNLRSPGPLPFKMYSQRHAVRAAMKINFQDISTRTRAKVLLWLYYPVFTCAFLPLASSRNLRHESICAQLVPAHRTILLAHSSPGLGRQHPEGSFILQHSVLYGRL